MFERFTKDARRVVTAAEAEARALDADAVAPEHLLLGFVVAACSGRWLVQPSALVTLDAMPRIVTAEELRAAILQGETEALDRLGISLEAVRARVEQELGAVAWRAASRKGHLPFTPEAKGALELALREAIELRRRRLTARIVLLGLLRCGGVHELLQRLEVPADEVAVLVRSTLVNEAVLATR